MADVEISFEREGLEGIVPVGTYLADAMRRFGLRLEPCALGANEHKCKVSIANGGDLLSAETASEAAFFDRENRTEGERLACQAKIEREGRIEVKTQEKAAEEAAEPKAETAEEYRKKFAELPLDKKMTELVQLEAIAMSETLSYVVNSPFTIADKVMDVLAGFGFSKEVAEKQSVRPEEHRNNGKESNDEAGEREKSGAKEAKD